MPQTHSNSVRWTMDFALHTFARSGQVDATRMQLRHGADTEIRDSRGFTPLLLSARYNQLEILQVLLQHGARTDATATLDNDFGHGEEPGTCLHFAAESGHVQILKFLVTAAALDLDERTQGLQEINVLHLAARLGRVDVVRFLAMRFDVDVNAQDAYGMTPLHHACDYPNAETGENRSPPTQYLSDAAHVDVVNTLIRAGAAIDIRRASDRATALKCALRHGHFLVVRTLVDHGAYTGVAKWVHKIKSLLPSPSWLNDTTRFSEPVATKAKKSKHFWSRRSHERESLWETEFSTVEESVGLRGSLTDFQESALHAACKAQSLRRLREALKDHNTINARLSSPACKTHEGWTALHFAAFIGWHHGLVLLLAHGANVELTTSEIDDTFGTTPLHLASQNGHISCVLSLLEAGADANVCDDLGNTPLLLALRHGRSRTVKVLLRHGANCANQDEVSPLSGPPQSNQSESMLGTFDPQKTTALHLAAFFGALPLIQELTKSSTSILSLDAVDEDGATPIWLAALMGHLEVVEILAQYGADLHHKVDGDSTADCAAEFGHLEVLEYVSMPSPGLQPWGSRLLTHLALIERPRVKHRRAL